MDKTERLLSLYSFEFEVALDDPDLRSCFRQFLVKIRNEESFLFLMELEKFVTFVGTATRYRAAERIVKEYLEVGAEKEVNVSSRLREATLRRFKTCSDTNCDGTLFNELRTAIFMELREDCMAGFIASDIFKAHVKKELKKNNNYLSRIGTVKPERRLSLLELEELYNFNDKPEITDDDFERVLKRCSEQGGEWDIIKQAKRCCRSLSRSDIKGFKTLKHVVYVPFSREEVFYITQCSEQAAKVDLDIFKSKRTHYHFMDFDKYRAVVTHQEVMLPFPLNNRYQITTSAVRRLPNGNIIMVSKTASVDNIPYNPKHVKATSLNGHIYEELPGGHCRYTILSFFDWAGIIPAPIWNKLISIMKTDSLVDVIEQAGYDRMSRSVSGPLLEHPLYQSLMYNQQKTPYGQQDSE
ncbi:regulator of G-protein signaling [Acrasis kona]|uniref:Regulator of G-protein signaling n=1 Tax=Acrasis kona TaxID=1008807 RepID=A0AAW2Z1G6_9EUKA